MSPERERCPACRRPLIGSRFDTTFRLADGSERLCFGIPGGLCGACHQLYIDPDLIDLLADALQAAADATYNQAKTRADGNSLKKLESKINCLGNAALPTHPQQ